MYSISRELFQYLGQDEIPSLVNLEVNEYARRRKLDEFSRSSLPSTEYTFNGLESSIGNGDTKATATIMSKLYETKGSSELASHLLLIGSGHLDESLGHSVSCTAFILLEMMKHIDQDLWPAFEILSDFFCRGEFNNIPNLKSSPLSKPLPNYLLCAASGSGIVNLHHTITLYAIERARGFLTPQQHSHMIDSWIDFLHNKRAEPVTVDYNDGKAVNDYNEFYRIFSQLEVKPVLACLVEIVKTASGRRELGRFLVRGVCDLYQGGYDPHHLTGLGSVLWVVDQYWRQQSIVITALCQYLDFFFSNVS
jgi:hypothetical protein